MKNNAFKASNSQRADNVSNNLNALNSHSYLNFIVLSLVLALLYGFCYFLMRLCLVYSAFDDFSLLNAFNANFLPMFVMGFRLDMRAVCLVVAFVLLLGLLTQLNKFAAKMTTGGGHLKKMISAKI